MKLQRLRIRDLRPDKKVTRAEKVNMIAALIKIMKEGGQGVSIIISGECGEALVIGGV